jgi:hypothetical protein
MNSATGNAAPLLTVGRNLTVASIGQSVSGIGQDNTLTITLQTNFDMQVNIAGSIYKRLAGTTHTHVHKLRPRHCYSASR